MSDVPGEVTLLCIGPLTNVALALRLDPKFLTKLKNLVVMGGSVEGECSVQNVCLVFRKYLTSYKYLHVYR